MTEIRTIPDDGQITEPGAYRISMNLYHSQRVCPDISVSSTGIRAATLKSPHAFWMTSDLNENRYPPKPESEYLILGKAAHCLILGDEVFAENFAYVPEDAPPRPTATQIKAFERDGFWSEKAAPGAAFWESFDAQAAGRSLLTAEQVTKIGYMAENLNANRLCVDLLKSDLVEISMVWQDEITGLWVKSRPDCIPAQAADFSDLKTFSPKGADLTLSAHRSITDQGYFVQMALACMGSEILFGESAENCALVFVQTTEPYEPVPVILDADALYYGRVYVRDGLDKIAHGLKTGQWPTRAMDMTTYSLPPSMQHRIGEMQLSGAMPNIART